MTEPQKPCRRRAVWAPQSIAPAIELIVNVSPTYVLTDLRTATIPEAVIANAPKKRGRPRKQVNG